MKHVDCESYKELLAANALTALDAADALALSTHLESCSNCLLEMNEWQSTAAVFALDAQPLEPSAQVRDRLLASVRAEPQIQRLTNDPVERFVPETIRQRPSGVLPFERTPRDVWASLRSFGAVAAALIFGALIIALVILWQQNRQTQSELARVSKEMQQAQTQLDHQRAVAKMLTSPDSHMTRLAGTTIAPGAHAMLAYDKDGHVMLMARGMPSAPKGMAYQLWYIKDNQKMPGKVFSPDAAGDGMLEDQMPTVAGDRAVFAITLEPENGVQVPTGSIYLLSAS